MWGYWDRDRPVRRARPVKGGLKASSKRGDFVEKWWGKRWVSVLEGFNLGARLTRGRNYARQGQVCSIEIASGRVLATVQGSAPTPYKIQIDLDVLSPSDWDRVIEGLGRQAIFAAKLLAGEMPNDVESIFTDLGLSLFPRRSQDLKTDCSCPDWSNPCKHIAAVFYLLGEHFDRDPFLIFRLRGLGRDALIERLEAYHDHLQPAPDRGAEAAPRPREPLSADLATFWDSPIEEGNPPPMAVEIVPRESAPLPRLLGPFPFWRGEESFLDALAAIQAAASPRGLEVCLGSEGEASRQDHLT